ncbi:hypothetical protein [Spirosoma jeollabukense]
MKTQSFHRAQIPNPALTPFSQLIGDWETAATHPAFPGKTVKGRSSFNWMEGGAFLIWYSAMDEEQFPDGIAIFSSDDATGDYFMSYFDERKVSRKYEVSVDDNVVKWWRNAPGFSQRYHWTITDDGNTIVGKGELCQDGTTWENDLDLTFTRLK